MLRFNSSTGAFEKLEETRLKTENLLERYDLQKAIVSSWELFKNEIGMPSAYLIGQEITPDNVTQNSIDLLAYDPDDSSLVVIELKRDKHKLHLLQALSYAAMVNRWDSDTLISKIQKDLNPDFDELVELISGNTINPDVRVILIAESYDPEVIITADWLSSSYSVDISAFAVSLHALDGQTFLSFDQRYPIKELDELYEARSQRKRKKTVTDDISWDDIIPKLKYKFAEKGIRLCQRHREGEPSRRRFGMIRTNHDGFNWISINFRQKYVNVYLKGQFEGAEEFLKSKFREAVTVGTWRDGYSIQIEKESQWEDLVGWLNLLEH